MAAAVAIGLGGITWALAINTVSFLAAIAAVASVALPPPEPDAAHEPFRRALLGGWHRVRAEPGLRVSFTLLCLNTFVAAPFIALIPAMAVKVLDGDEATTGILVTAQGVGAVAAGAVMGGLVMRHGLRLTMVGAVAGTGPALIAYGLAPNLATMALALAALGFCYMVALSTFSTAAQQRSPDHVVGRVLAVNMAVLGALYPLGALIQGRIADAVGLRATTVASGMVLAVSLLFLRASRPGYTDPLAHAVAIGARNRRADEPGRHRREENRRADEPGRHRREENRRADEPGRHRRERTNDEPGRHRRELTDGEAGSVWWKSDSGSRSGPGRRYGPREWPGRRCSPPPKAPRRPRSARPSGRWCSPSPASGARRSS